MDRALLSAVPSADVVDAMCQLRALANATEAEFLDLVAVYDERELWREDGALDMEGWIVLRCGESRERARDFVRMARALASLPRIREAFSTGRISLSQLAQLTRY